MPGQFFKSVYFSDLGSETKQKTFKLAFGTNDYPVAQWVCSLSSYDIRLTLGSHSFADLHGRAKAEGLALNTYCVRILRERLRRQQMSPQQASLPGFGKDNSHSTFRIAKTTPLHRWYPFIQGYSPQFVEEILSRYAPRASRVFDPFAGVGTTPITAARLGLDAFYCELNPLLQFLTKTKIQALLLSNKQRRQYDEFLLDLAQSFVSGLSRVQPDRTLALSYERVFGESVFFSPETFSDILRARAFVDNLACEDYLLSEFVSVAIVASLIPASNLCRAGDLRFRREKEIERICPFGPLVSQQLERIAEDIRTAEAVENAPTLIGCDAKRLEELPPLDADAVITSPPYLNGTNYFRNSKVELWFLRALCTRDDLTALRNAAVTAGINDVTGLKGSSDDPNVKPVVQALSSSAYDRRIPQMVSSYFWDVEKVLAALRKHLQPGGILCLDIGDSVYAKTHVPTDVLVSKIAERLGYEQVETVPLRTRVSRDTTRLKQVLLVFRHQGPRPEHCYCFPASQQETLWEEFKQKLPHQQRPLSKRNWGHPLHSLCSYQGKMKPSLAHMLVKIFVPVGGRMLDPFAGVGTIPFEAALNGSTAFGYEISPAAYVIAAAKLGRPIPNEVERNLTDLEEFIVSRSPTVEECERAAEIQFNSRLTEYFHPKTLREVLLARRFFQKFPPQQASELLVMASLLHILHGNRPYALSRRSHPITPFAPSGNKEYRSLMSRLRDKVGRSLEAGLPSSFKEGKIFQCDATSCWPQEVDNLDAVITSPPFFDSTRFYLANWMRLWFAGWERSDFRLRPRRFLDERQKASFNVYESVLRQARERLRRGGLVVLHLGWSPKCDMASEIEKVASHWFRVVDRFSESVKHCESHGVRDKGTVHSHQYLILE